MLCMHMCAGVGRQVCKHTRNDINMYLYIYIRSLLSLLCRWLVFLGMMIVVGEAFQSSEFDVCAAMF